jgi:hypothetical protein
MKRKWLYIGVTASSVFQFVFEWFWRQLLPVNPHRDICPIPQESSQLAFIFLSGVTFALVVGFFYLHVPDQKRSLKSGISIGTILGLLIGLYHSFDLYGLFTFSFSAMVVEIIKTMILGIICGAAISLAELKTNPRTKSAQPD